MASKSPKGPGLLYVTMQPKPILTWESFHDWYNNEHGPNRNRLPCCENGFRYRATDVPREGMDDKTWAGSNEMPEWMATYDIVDMDDLTRDPYTALRTDAVKSQREKDVMAEIQVDRRLFDLIDEKKGNNFFKIEDMANYDKAGSGNTFVSVSCLVDSNEKPQLDGYYLSLVASLSQNPTWRRTRRFITSVIEPRPDGKIEYMAIHEFDPSTPTISSLTDSIPFKAALKHRTYDLYYTFDACPRHISHAIEWSHPDGLQHIFPNPSSPGSSIIESFITTSDGVALPFRLEGNPDPEAPLIVLSNSILTNWAIWDSFLGSFFADPQNKKYRVLRYLTRGRGSACGDRPITVDVLGDDIIAILDVLRVRKAACVVGVSLGGATAMNVGLRYPDRVAGFVACDTSAKSPAGNSQAWEERIAVAEKEGAVATTTATGGVEVGAKSGEEIVGEELAELTVRRWFVPESYDRGLKEVEVEKVKEMVKGNSLEGFKKSVRALWEYDMEGLLKFYQGRGAFVVGGGDGKLPASMKGLAGRLGEEGVELTVVEGAGHLPMVEKGREVAEFVSKVLR